MEIIEKSGRCRMPCRARWAESEEASSYGEAVIGAIIKSLHCRPSHACHYSDRTPHALLAALKGRLHEPARPVSHDEFNKIMVRDTPLTPHQFPAREWSERNQPLLDMRSDEYLHVMLRAMRQDAAYSSKRHAWLIPVLKAKIYFLEQMDELPPEFRSIEEVVEEGVRRGFWERDSVTDVLLMK